MLFHRHCEKEENSSKLKANIRNQTKSNYDRSYNNSCKNGLNKEEKTVKKVFYEKSQILLISMVSMSFKAWCPPTLQYMIL